MKTRNLLLLLSLIGLNSLISTAQQHVWLTTPNNSRIEGVLFDELSDYEKQQIKAQIRNQYPDAQISDDPSNLYNCHSYAWNMVEGGPKCWINKIKEDSSANLSLYWEDHSYEQTNGSLFNKIHYYQGDHSAVPSGVAGKYESKWGNGPLVRHAPTDVPAIYKANYRHYYLRKITLLPGSTYQFKHPNTQAATWSASGLGSNMNIQPSTGLLTNHNPKFTGTITVNGTNSGGSYAVAVPVQGEYIQGYYTIDGVQQNFKTYYPSYPVYPIGLNINKGFSITITPPENATVNWVLESGNLVFRQNGYGIDVNPVHTYGRIRADVKTSQGTMQELFCINVGAPIRLSFTLNDQSLRIKREINSEEVVPFLPEMTAFNELVYPDPLNSSQTYTYEIVGITKANRVEKGEILLSENGEAEVNVASLPAGYYILTITSNQTKVNSYKFIKK